MKTRARNWLLIAGSLSGYTFDLLESVAALGGVDVRILYTPLDRLPSFQHEDTDGRRGRRLAWKDASWSQIRQFVREPVPDAVFVYGTQPRLKLNFALTQIPRATQVWYAADTNILELDQHPVRTPMRRLLCAPIAARATAALSLGPTNRRALEALGYRRIIDLPVYAVDFAALDAAASSAGDRASEAANGEVVLLVLARLTPVKNLPGFVSAFAQDLELSRKIRLVIAGEGPDRAALEDIQRRSPSLKMQLMGAVARQRVGALLRQADALVLPSLVEPWGIVVVEALGMGLPVIATPVVGAAVSLAASSDAILLSDNPQPASILAALRRFLAHRSRLAEVARTNMPEIRTRFDRLAVAKATLRLVYSDDDATP